MTSDFEATRRELLTGRLRPAVPNPKDPETDTVPSSDIDLVEQNSGSDSSACLIHLGRRAMACQFEVILSQSAHEKAKKAAVDALDLVDQIEDQLSVYRDHSTLSHLNRAATQGEVTVEPELFHLIRRCVTIYEDTAGAFDITSTPLSKLWGFYRRQGSMPSPAQIETILEDIGSCHLCLNASIPSVRFGRPRLEINFNSIGKGYALNRCSELLTEHAVNDFLLHGGQSSVYGRGLRNRIASDARGWKVALRHPIRPDLRLLEIELFNQALATSGSATQSFHHRGKRYGHILDPRTGWPADTVYSATVVSSNAALADALSTAFYVMKLEEVVEYCHRHDDVSTILATKNQRTGTMEVHVVGSIERQITPLALSQKDLILHSI